MTTEPSRPLLVLRVAAGSALGSSAAVIAVGLFANRDIEEPLIVSSAVVLVALLCAVAVVMVPSDQDTANDTRVRVPVPVPVVPSSDRSPLPGSPPPTSETISAEPRPGFELAGGPTAATATGGLPWHEAAAFGVAGTAPRAVPAPPALSAPAEAAHELVRGSPPGQQEIRLGPTDSRRAVRRIVQCPRCGSFSVRADQVRDGCTFECHDCGHPWHWRPGAPWPLTLIRPRLRRSDPRSPAASPAVWRMPS